jgi:hypothetical protein
MTAFTWPLTTLCLFAIGLVAVVPRLLPAPLRKRWAQRVVLDDRRTDFLVFFAGFLPFSLFALGRVPIFGATKHWLPAMPFFCLLAGVGFSRALGAAWALARRAPRGLVAAAFTVACLVGPFVETRASHPFALSHYTALAGGTPVAPWLDRHVRRGGSVQPHDTLWLSWGMLQRDGRLRRDIRYGRDASSSDYALVHLEQHWSELEYAIWDDYGSAVPIHVLSHEGVPIVPVYRNPR